MTIITYPWPPKELSPNNRSHWSKRAKQAAEMKRIGFFITKQEKPDLAGMVTISMRFNPPTAARHDMDNCLARCKSLIDGISQAIGIDDSKFRFVLEMGSKVKGGSVVVELIGEERLAA